MQGSPDALATLDLLQQTVVALGDPAALD